MPYEFKMVRQVEFADTDMAGIVHFSNFFRYMENTEHAFYRSLGFSVISQDEGEGVGENVGWPRVHAQCDYLHPLRFEDTVEIHLLVRQRTAKSISYDFHFVRTRPEPSVEVAHGALTVVAVAYDRATGRMHAVAIPEATASRIEVAPAELLIRKET